MKTNRVRLILLFLTISIVFFTGCTNARVSDPQDNPLPKTEKENAAAKPVTDVSGELKVHFIDVGKADAILITQGDHAMLIDAGNAEDAETVSNYLLNQGISKLDYLIGTHPHEDHIGGLSYIINHFQNGVLLMPEVENPSETALEDTLNAAASNGLTVNNPVVGQSFALGEALCTILGPMGSEENNINSYSIVVRVDFGNTSFLFAGDAQTINETAMIKAGENLKADVLKIGHHGSSGATSQAFLDAVKPIYGVISVGEENSYGLPAKTTLKRLADNGIELYRTDLNGTVVATSNGTEIHYNK